MLLTLVLTCASSSAWGLVYSWTDTRGITHYTNKEYEIPAPYRAKTKALYPEQGDVAPAQQTDQGHQVTPAPPPAKPAEPTPPPRRRHRESDPGAE
ncbi:MAG TPA: hypothetical protein VIH45_01855 [Desulfuromonadaceae bacterium]